MIFHLAAESHVDKSITKPIGFLESNIIGTFNLLEAAKEHWQKLPTQRKKEFNREQLQDAMTHIEEKLGIMTLSFDEIWSRLDEKDYQETPNNWVPRDPKWRIQGE